MVHQLLSYRPKWTWTQVLKCTQNLDQEGKAIQMKRKSFKQIPREIKHSYIKHTHAHRHTTNVDTDLTHFKKISKHLLDLNVKCKSNKLLENNKEGNVGDFGFFDEFSNITQNARSVKENKNVEFHFIGRKKTPCSEVLRERKGKPGCRGKNLCKTPMW